MNQVVIIGRITREPELHKSADASCVCGFTVAVDRDEKHTDFIPVVCFKGLAENVAKFVRKGNLIAVSGRLSQRDFVRQDGTKGQAIEVIAQTVEFLEKKPAEAKPEAKPKAKKKKAE